MLEPYWKAIQLLIGFMAKVWTYSVDNQDWANLAWISDGTHFSMALFNFSFLQLCYSLTIQNLKQLFFSNNFFINIWKQLFPL